MTKKRIKILTRGPIRVKGFINGPVLTPYFEDISTIFAMISQGIHVVEVCDDRTEIRLTTSNITDDNSKAAREEKAALLQAKTEEPEKVKEVETVATINEVIDDELVVDTAVKEVVEKTEPVVEEKVEEVKEEQTTSEKTYQKPNYNNQYNNKHNKHNNYKNNNYRKDNQIRVETPKSEPIKIGE